MFDDTDQPTCLALWGPTVSADFEVWSNGTLLGWFSELLAARPCLPPYPPVIRFNDPSDQIGLIAVDTPSAPTIAFVPASRIDPSEIKHSSRHRTRIQVEGLADGEVPQVIVAANDILRSWREVSRDIGLTAFMGLRKDGCFRRRLDFATARAIVVGRC